MKNIILSDMQKQDKESVVLYSSFIDFLTLLNYSMMVSNRFKTEREQNNFIDETISRWQVAKKLELEKEFDYLSSIQHKISTKLCRQKLRIKECALEDMTIHFRQSLKIIMEEDDDVETS